MTPETSSGGSGPTRALDVCLSHRHAPQTPRLLARQALCVDSVFRVPSATGPLTGLLLNTYMGTQLSNCVSPVRNFVNRRMCVRLNVNWSFLFPGLGQSAPFGCRIRSLQLKRGPGGVWGHLSHEGDDVSQGVTRSASQSLALTWKYERNPFSNLIVTSNG